MTFMFFYCGSNDLEITLGNILTFAILFIGHGIHILTIYIPSFGISLSMLGQLR